MKDKFNNLDSLLEFSNSYGGFASDGREYHILLTKDSQPPMPWINVVANPGFGLHISETGAGYTWANNSRENKITAWSNDPVLDLASEALYIVDTTLGKMITPTSLGRKVEAPYRVCHGFGYSRYEHSELEMNLKTTVFVAQDQPLKLWHIQIHNSSQTTKRLAIYYYIEWTLGVERSQSNPFIKSEFHLESDYLYAQNVYAHDYQKNPAFMFCSEKVKSYTGNKKEFIGTGSVKNPGGIFKNLSNQCGSFDENAGVIQMEVTLEPNQSKTLIFGLGQCQEHLDIQRLCQQYKEVQNVEKALEEVHQHWQQLLTQTQIKTSHRALDIMMNGWLLYQTIACRIDARAAFYQCGGAFGYRDQLQDALSLLHTRPQVVRKQILLAASRQFEEGDVQHWWHPPTGVGVRTKISDDLLWLPYVLAHYCKVTGDKSILEEQVSYIKGPLLLDNQHEAMSTPTVSTLAASVYEHAKQTILHTKLGEHGLPLMGGGDWNDGMNKVGIAGKGESVWLGWFLYAVAGEFKVLAKHQQDQAFVEHLQDLQVKLQTNLETHAWDGKWYLRAFYDDGTKIGSQESDECKIDSISQSWSIMSHSAPKERALKAFQSAWRYLVLKKEKMSLLLYPPFNQSLHNPGYIKNYYPGIRENGGQYSHASVWLAIAATQIQDYSRAWMLFDMLNPINHSLDKLAADHYQKEPYVLCGDIAYEAPYTGRGGWSWYTGSAGWLYQGILQYFLGISKEGEELIINPATPKEFLDYRVEYRYHSSLYILLVIQKVDQSKSNKLIVDDKIIKGNRFKLIDDGLEHTVIYTI